MSALDGVVYEVDLNQSHAAQLRAILEPYLIRARPASKASAAPAAEKTARVWRDRRRQQEHRAMTAQIRQAAQRSRDQAQARQAAAHTPAEPQTSTLQPGAHPVPIAPDRFPARTERTGTERHTVPLPQFLSAPLDPHGCESGLGTPGARQGKGAVESPYWGCGPSGVVRDR